MVQGIADDSILLRKQRFKHTAVGIKARSIEDGILGLEIVADGSLQFLVDILCATNEAYARHAEASTIHHLLRSLNQTGMIRQAQIVVGTEVEHFLSCHLNGCTLRTLNESLFLVKSCFTNLSECLAEMFFHLSVHSS